MTPRAALALLPLLCATPAAAHAPFHACTVVLPSTPTRDALPDLAQAIERAGCMPGDPLVLVGSSLPPRALAAVFCRANAGVQISEMPGSAGATAQVDCEYPGRTAVAGRLRH